MQTSWVPDSIDTVGRVCSMISQLGGRQRPQKQQLRAKGPQKNVEAVRNRRIPIMAASSIFTATAPEFVPLLEDLRQREPIFHTERFGRSLEDFNRGTAPDFWEVGASGRRYSRDFILDMRSRESLVDADEAGWTATGFALRRLGPDCYLLTYTLDQSGRLTRRATIWERVAEDWRVVYHQGTVITANEDDTLPRPEEMPPDSHRH
ncbi:MAG TPA: hypothetical protein VGF82_17945 [Terracidiphilus sp.]